MLTETGKHTVHPRPGQLPSEGTGQTEAPQCYFPGHKATVPPRMLYGEHLFRAQDTRVSLVLENHARSRTVFFPLFLLKYILHLHVGCAYLWRVSCHGLGSPVTGLSPFQAGQQALSKPQ